jgi:hypothetical protein
MLSYMLSGTAQCIMDGSVMESSEPMVKCSPGGRHQNAGAQNKPVYFIQITIKIKILSALCVQLYNIYVFALRSFDLYVLMIGSVKLVQGNPTDVPRPFLSLSDSTLLDKYINN